MRVMISIVWMALMGVLVGLAPALHASPAELQTPISPSATLDYEGLQKEWDKALNTVANAVTDKDVPTQDALDVHKQALRDVRDAALAVSEPLKMELSAKEDLLRALGKAPEDPSTEAAEIKTQRDSLNEEVASIDARLKNTKLIIARAEELLSTIDDYEQNRLRNELFARDTSLLSATIVPAVTQQAVDYVQRLPRSDGWLQWALVTAGVLASLLLAPRINRYLNHTLSARESVQLKRPFRASRVLTLMLAASIALWLRLDVMVFSSAHRLLEDALQATLALILALLLFSAFGKLRFVPRPERHDSLGEHRKEYHWLWNSAKRLTMLALMAASVMVVVGYVNLGLYIAFNIYVTTVACLLFIWLRAQAVALNQRFQPRPIEAEEEGGQEPVKPSVHVNAKGKGQLSPIAITILEPILALLSIAIAAFFWGTTADDVAVWGDHLRHGFTVGDITIDVLSIGSAIVLFFVLSLISKMLQWFLGQRVFPYTALDMGLQEAVLTITGYIGVIIAVLASMSAIGLNMSNLAIVAGALSVGIGFGLQAIFNNFVSGLILLFERPFKVGDWIVVGAHQGLIKKIRVRSTEIETFQNASIIVPNSMLISEPVTNWTLHDEVGRVDVAVSIAYGADTDKVRQILLKIAKDNQQVRTYPSARVFFINFGDSAMQFELRCFIRNINDAASVSSELRFAIDKAFREQGISMPFPKHDVYLHSVDGTVQQTLVSS
jgi:small-conductance mechanosensitive channel